MSYEPQERPRKGLQSMLGTHMRTRCDVCGRARSKGNHDACSKQRQDAGFVFKEHRK